MTVSELNSKMTQKEFKYWVSFYSEQWHKHEKIDYYLAQITASLSGTSINNALISFKGEKESKSNIKLTGDQLKNILVKELGAK